VTTQKVLDVKGKVIYHISFRSLIRDEIQSPSETQARLDFYEAVEKKLGPSTTKDDFKNDPDFAHFETPTVEPREGEEFPACKMPDIGDGDDVDTHDQYVGARVRVSIGDEIQSGKFMGQA
jgi:hypothetical protein